MICCSCWFDVTHIIDISGHFHYNLWASAALLLPIQSSTIPEQSTQSDWLRAWDRWVTCILYIYVSPGFRNDAIWKTVQVVLNSVHSDAIEHRYKKQVSLRCLFESCHRLDYKTHCCSCLQLIVWRAPYSCVIFLVYWEIYLLWSMHCYWCNG